MGRGVCRIMCKEDLIEIARSKMINSIRENGFLSKKTIQLSQELDVYIWEQQKQKINTKFLKKK
ncbi:Spo0E family sporulation regulatory protein-aspartic acid phosphatase [Cytobacillus firmus]|uniref:Spo0E family sporulation regulatory protein-aspartic acid phosphatase n=1 Tax=Cytobacillus firmus TaxID=1399 RepID=UPI0037C01072